MLSNDKIKEIANINRMLVQQIATHGEATVATLKAMHANALLHSELDSIAHIALDALAAHNAEKIHLATMLKQQEHLIKSLMAEIEKSINN